MQALLDRAPTDNGAVTDRRGRQEFSRAMYVLAEPLSDPWGGTDVLSLRQISI